MDQVPGPGVHRPTNIKLISNISDSVRDHFIPISEAGTFIDLTYSQPVILQKVVKLKKQKSSTQQSLLKKNSGNVKSKPTPPPPLVKIAPTPVPVPVPAPVPPPPPGDQKLFIVKNGELKSIKKSNIASSGIILPIKAGPSNTSGSQPNLRPISSTFIVSNDIPGGIMTMDQYRRKKIMQRAVTAAAATDPVTTIYKVIRPTDIDLDSAVEFAQVILKNKPGRKKGVTNKKPANESSLLEPVPAGSRTRSGRLSRPPRHIQRFYTKDNDGTGRIEELLSEEEFPEPPPMIKKPPKRLFERLKCDACGKSYVNERQLQHHITVAHHEMGGTGGGGGLGEHVDDNLRIDCFNYLLTKLKRVPMKLRGRIFLDEMELFVKKVHRLMQKLIRRFDGTCMKEGFLNYSQVHQIPKALEAMLNVSAGQYHFNTEVIDADEKTILASDNDNDNAAGAGEYQEMMMMSGNTHPDRSQDNETMEEEEHRMDSMVLGGVNESALSGFDDSSTQPLIGGSDDTRKDSFVDHIISLEDAIYGPSSEMTSTTTVSNDGVTLLSSAEEDDDDLTTPKKGPHPSPSTRRLKKVKRAIQNLNKTSSFPIPHDQLLTRDDQVHLTGCSVGGTGMIRPVIKDLSMELFRSPNIRGGSGGGGGGSGVGSSLSSSSSHLT